MTSRESGLDDSSGCQTGLPAIQRQIGATLTEIRCARVAGHARFALWQVEWRAKLAEISAQLAQIPPDNRRGPGGADDAPDSDSGSRPQLAIHDLG